MSCKVTVYGQSLHTLLARAGFLHPVAACAVLDEMVDTLEQMGIEVEGMHSGALTLAALHFSGSAALVGSKAEAAQRLTPAEAVSLDRAAHACVRQLAHESPDPEICCVQSLGLASLR